MKKDRKQKVSFKKICMTLFLCIPLIIPAQVCYAEENLYSLSAVLLDGESGRVLYGKDENLARPMASTTKIMTCILALERCGTDEIVTVSRLAQSQPKVHAGLQENEQYFLLDLLLSLMLESHNDSAVAIAEHVGGSVEGFAELMNQKAVEIGCKSANFITPNGLDDENEMGKHSISAKDLALIMCYCVSKSPRAKQFLEITQTRNHSFQEITGKRSISCANHNAFLDMMKSVISGKTGFTGEAGYCYVGALERDGRLFTIALLGCGWPNNKTYKWSDARKLFSYGLEHYQYEDVWEEKEGLKVSVQDGIKSFVEGEVIANERELLVLKSKEETISCDVIWRAQIKAPIKKGDVLGEVRYYLDEEKIASYDIVASEEVEKRTVKWYYLHLLKTYFTSSDLCYTSS